jgi:hypothetical protein
MASFISDNMVFSEDCLLTVSKDAVRLVLIALQMKIAGGTQYTRSKSPSIHIN